MECLSDILYCFAVFKVFKNTVKLNLRCCLKICMYTKPEFVYLPLYIFIESVKESI